MRLEKARLGAAYTRRSTTVLDICSALLPESAIKISADSDSYVDHPSKYSFVGPSEGGFNPKAATQGSWSPPRARPIPDGPLIKSKEFNRHPDSYFVVPYGQLEWKSMSPRTKSKVKWTRLTQLFLRICELLGAVGMLFCVICIKGTDATTGWIIRVPPSIAILHTVYAIYHLCRSSKGRTPASSASYMLFAAILDVGLIPFLVFTILISHTQSVEPTNAPGHWTTLFGTDGATTKIVYSTFLLSVVTGGLHVVSLIISIYLGVIFRKIAQLPPDMNPLEDNLTSRHKRNKSSILDNRMSQATTATANSQKEDPKAEDPLISPPRTVPFMHTRNASQDNIMDVSRPKYSPRGSRTDVSTPFYDQPPAHRSSRTNIQGPFYEKASNRSSRTNLQAPFYEQAPSHHSSRTNVQSQFHDESPVSHQSSRTQFHAISLDESPVMQGPSPKQTSEPAITRSPTKSSSIYSSSTITTIATSRPGSARPRSAVSSPPDSNWITHPSPSASPSPSPPRELKHLSNKSSYQPLSQTSPFEYNSQKENMPKPLEMNPPTPPIQQQKRRQTAGQRALTPRNGNAGEGNWDGPGTIGIGKARAWGGMGRSDGGMNNGGMGGGGRVVSRSGVEVGARGILPSGGIRAREVSGKVMEEGRETGGGWM